MLLDTQYVLCLTHFRPMFHLCRNQVDIVKSDIVKMQIDDYLSVSGTLVQNGLMKDTRILPRPVEQSFLKLLITFIFSSAFVCCKVNELF